MWEALRAGYRHIDCASVYGNEEEVGEALERALGTGALAREELFVVSKVWWVLWWAALGGWWVTGGGCCGKIGRAVGDGNAGGCPCPEKVAQISAASSSPGSHATAIPSVAPAPFPRTPPTRLHARRNNDHSAERVRAACLRSLQALRLDYLDLYMVSGPQAGRLGLASAVALVAASLGMAGRCLAAAGLLPVIGT